MLWQPSVLALSLVSALQAVIAAAVVPYAFGLARHWDPAEATARQVRLEQRAHLVSTLVVFVAVLQAATLPIFVFTADRLAGHISGAMCGVGALNANAYGFPALVAQTVAFFAAAGWIALDRLDARVPASPLTRVKFGLVAELAVVLLVSGVLEWLYFLNLRPDVITSCCARVFAPEAPSVSGHVAALAPGPAAVLFFGVLAASVAASVRASVRADNPAAAAVAATLGIIAFPVAIAGVISFVSPAVYDDVLHHCPFCLLKSEYGHQGYAIYLPLFAGAASSLWLGCAALASRMPALRPVLPDVQRRWAAAATLGYTLVAVVAGIMITKSHVTLFG